MLQLHCSFRRLPSETVSPRRSDGCVVDGYRGSLTDVRHASGFELEKYDGSAGHWATVAGFRTLYALGMSYAT